MRHFLYKRGYNSAISIRLADGYEFGVFLPHIGKLYLPGEGKSLKTTIARFLFWLYSFGKAKIAYIKDVKREGMVCHCSYIIPRIVKFPFMKKQDLEIGPCYTVPEFRGQGLYPKMLLHITSQEEYKNSDFWMIVEEKNEASIRGIEKAGFQKVGEVKRTRFFKRYIQVRE